ncbi:MAG: DNA gyrase subunit A [Alphaproteobacteria bacterium]|nr:DNA gyrase subunit A [Alphaproteobacteria bacterium]
MLCAAPAEPGSRFVYRANGPAVTTGDSSERAATPVSIEEEMKRSYLGYAMSVIVARALPDVRDGLKPVHRRILYAMHEGGYRADRPYRKSARIVGEVMGKYHPHGDQAIYDAMVRMAQPFSMRLPLMDGQGNFGSMDGDPPAAMRYTETRMARAGEALLDDIDRDTVDFEPTYDGSASEPSVLPARFPNLLVNGAGGIAVGMATNIPPHNLGEVIDACCAYLDDPEISVDGLMSHVLAPDFPTGGLIMGLAGARAAFRTGRGSLTVRARVHIEEHGKDRAAIVATEIPFLVNKARLVEHIAEVVRDKRVEGIADLRDESDRDGVRVVIEVRRDASPEIVLNQLYRHTPLETTFGVNTVALRGGRPLLLNLRDLISAFVEFRTEVITRRTAHDLGKARERAQVLVGLAIAVANIDAVIALIRAAPDPAAARAALTGRAWPAADVAALIALIDDPGNAIRDGAYRLNELQARAILDLRLQRLTGLERDKIAADLGEIATEIKRLLSILQERPILMALLREELLAVKERFATPRRTEVSEATIDQEDEDLIQSEDIVVTMSHHGYVKRVPLSAYRAQRRGGRGRSGMATREEDFVTQVFVVNTHTRLLFFSTTGRVYMLKAYRLPAATPQGRGKALINMLPLAQGETVATLMPMPGTAAQWDELEIVLATARGNIRRNRLSDFASIMANGKIAMKLAPDDRIVGVQVCAPDQDVLLAARSGKCIRFPVTAVRLFKGRTSAGVRGMRVKNDDALISLSTLRHVEVAAPERRDYMRAESRLAPERRAELARAEEFILTVTENGYGKRTSAYEYTITGRGGLGIINIETSKRNGAVVASFTVADGDEVVLVTDGGQLIRTPVNDIRIAGRDTQGVTLIRMAEGEHVVSVARLAEAGVGEDDADPADALPAAPSS